MRSQCSLQIRQTAHVQVLANNMAAALRLFMGFFREVIPLYVITLCLYMQNETLHLCLKHDPLGKVTLPRRNLQ